MTREEALQILDTIPTIGEQEDALELAIEALSAEPCEDCISREYILSKAHCCRDDLADDEPCCVDVDDIKEAPSVQPKPIECEDCISRAEALNIINIEGKWIFNNDKVYSPVNVGIALTSMKKKIKELPSIQPKPKWIPIKTRPLTNKEKEECADLGFSEDLIDFMYDCPLPEDGEEVLITTRYDEVRTDTFYRDEGCYFETYCDEDDVKAWMPLPEPYKAESEEA